MRGAVLLVCLVTACGGGKAPSAEDNRTRGTGNGEPGTGDKADAAVARMVWPDAGVADDPVVVADAGLMEAGAAQCEMVIARLIACPSVGAEHKKDLSRQQAEIRQLAVDPKNREQVAATCRQLVEAMEETLRRLSC